MPCAGEPDACLLLFPCFSQIVPSPTCALVTLPPLSARPRPPQTSQQWCAQSAALLMFFNATCNRLACSSDLHRSAVATFCAARVPSFAPGSVLLRGRVQPPSCWVNRAAPRPLLTLNKALVGLAFRFWSGRVSRWTLLGSSVSPTQAHAHMAMTFSLEAQSRPLQTSDCLGATHRQLIATGQRKGKLRPSD